MIYLHNSDRFVGKGKTHNSSRERKYGNIQDTIQAWRWTLDKFLQVPYFIDFIQLLDGDTWLAFR
jgi:hypothetical protein